MVIPKRNCRNCNTEFQPANKYQTFCTIKCRSAKGYEKAKAKRKKEKEIDNSKDIFRFEDYGKDVFI